MNQAPTNPNSSSGRVMPATKPRMRLICSPCWLSSCLRMLARVSCISARLIQICRLPTRCTGADTRFEWMVLWNTNQSPVWSSVGSPPPNSTFP